MKYFGYFVLIAVVVVFVSTCSRTTEPTTSQSGFINLKRQNDSAIVDLNYNGTVNVNNEVLIKFTGVAADSRCPKNTFCFWPGDGEVKLNLSDGNSEQETSIHTYLDPQDIVFNGYHILLKTLNPYPDADSTTIKQEDYKIELLVEYANWNVTENVKLIDNYNNSDIKKDLLNVNNVSLNNGRLNFDLSYTGGCKTHSINLYAFKGIQKSNPAQVTLMLSHDAEGDNCEAIVQKKLVFDLTALKEYLKDHFNIQDKVILLLFDPQGRPLNNPVIEYNLQ